MHQSNNCKVTGHLPASKMWENLIIELQLPVSEPRATRQSCSPTKREKEVLSPKDLSYQTLSKYKKRT